SLARRSAKAVTSEVRVGRMPIDIRMSAMAEAPAGAPSGVESGPLSQPRKSQAAACSSAEALALTTVIHEYEIERAVSPDGPTGIGAVAISAKASPMPALSADSHQLAMMIMPVLPDTKLSRKGPVALASAVAMAGSEQPEAMSFS